MSININMGGLQQQQPFGLGAPGGFGPGFGGPGGPGGFGPGGPGGPGGPQGHNPMRKMMRMMMKMMAMMQSQMGGQMGGPNGGGCPCCRGGGGFNPMQGAVNRTGGFGF